MADTASFEPQIRSKYVLTVRCLMWLTSTEKMGLEGCFHMRLFSVTPQGELEISSIAEHPPSMGRDHISSPELVS